MTYKEYKNALSEIGVSYLGKFSQSAKMVLNEKNGVITYCLYLAPWKLASTDKMSINTCPAGKNCAPFCLNGSGRNKGDIILRGVKESIINKARIKKTQLFFRNRNLFMDILCYELESAREYAKKKGMEFSVRLNCTSDISPRAFRYLGGSDNILDMYPDVKFYDYTKVSTRLELTKEYPSYDLTFSFDGYNWDTCAKFLEEGVNVAVVFESSEIPISFKGYRVIDMTKSDLRYYDPKSNDGTGFVGYLHFHRPASLYKNGKYERPNTPFVIQEHDPALLYAFKDVTPKDFE